MKRSMLTAWIAAVGVVFPAASFAQDSQETVEALRREVSQLKIDLESMRVALSELAELDKRRSEVLRRLLNRTATSPSEASAGTSAPPPPSSTSDDRKAPPPPPPPSRTARRTRDRGTSGGGVVEGRVEVPSGEPVAYVFVENVRGRAVRDRTVTIKQQNKRFAPGWAVVERGTTIEFPNLDAIYHNVFSLSSGNTFDLGLYRAGEGAKSYRFMNAGVVDLYCNIHPRMAASVLVLPNRHFAKVQPDGTFRIEGVPSGKRKIVAWSPGSDVSAEWTNVGSGSASVALALKKRSTAHKNKFGKPYGSYP